jgi:hypothetical protein
MVGFFGSLLLAFTNDVPRALNQRVKVYPNPLLKIKKIAFTMRTLFEGFPKDIESL